MHQFVGETYRLYNLGTYIPVYKALCPRAQEPSEYNIS